MLTKRIFDTPAWDFDVTKPFAEIERLRRRMDRLFDEWMPSTWKAGRTMGVFPLVNLTEDRESYILRAEIPGVKAEDLDHPGHGQKRLHFRGASSSPGGGKRQLPPAGA